MSGAAAAPPQGLPHFCCRRSPPLPGGRGSWQPTPHSLASGAGCAVAHPAHAACPPPPRRYYLLAQRPQRAPQAQHDAAEAAGPAGGVHLAARCCNLAWPKAGSCLLAWLRHLAPQHSPQGLGSLTSAASRLQQEHSSLGKRLVRLLRRAVALTEQAGSSCVSGRGDGGGGAEGSAGGADSGQAAAASGPAAVPAQHGAAGSRAAGGAAREGSPGSTSIVHVELEAWHEGLLPCGGAIFVQLTAAPEVLCAAGGTPPSGQQQAAAGTPGARAALEPGSGAESGAGTAQGPAGQSGGEPGQRDGHAFAAEATVMRLLGGGAGAVCSAGKGGEARSSVTAAAPAPRARPILLKPVSPEDAALHARQQAVQLYRPPPTDGGSGAAAKALRFMRLEPVEQLQQAGLAAAVLHAHKMAQHLALRLSCGTGLDGEGCRQCAAGRGTGATAGSPGKVCPACCARCMTELCAELNGCVVGLDVHLLPGRADATWVLYLPGLQQLAQDELAAAVLRHFARTA